MLIVSTGRSDVPSVGDVNSRNEMLCCSLCAESNYISRVFKRGDSAIYRCERCHFEFLFPQPSDALLSAIYSDSYFLGEKTAVALLQREFLKRATAKLYLDAIVPFVQVQKPQLLEIGCGSGEFLMEAQSRGFEVEGLEYSEYAANDANDRLGHAAVYVGSPEAECVPRNTYDIIGAFDVIEHLRNPIRALEYLSASLKPQGLLALVTPSLDSWSRRLLGSRWMEYKTEHLTYFSRKSLLLLLEATGFELIRFRANYKVLNLDYIGLHFDRFEVPILSPAVKLVRTILPAKVTRRPIKVMASGLMALARKKE